MEYYRCENFDCRYLAEDEEPDVCPRCGGRFFYSLVEDDLSGADGLFLSERASDSGDSEAAAARLCDEINRICK